MEYDYNTYIHQEYIRKATPRFSVPLSQEECEEMLTAFYMAEVKLRAIPYQDDQATKDHLHAAAIWLTDPRMKSGLYLFGNAGTGKTTLSKAIQAMIVGLYHLGVFDKKIENNTFLAINASTISRESLTAKGEAPVLFMDDIGTETTVVCDYGTEYYPVRYLISKRYYRPQLMTVITSNMDDAQIEKKYGKPILERIIEMCDIMQFDNPSYRC